MVVEIADRAARDESGALASTLRLVGVGKLVLAALTLVLAFTGYDTPRAVNVEHLFVGVNLLMLGWVCLVRARSFARAAGAGEAAPPALALALVQANRLFGYYLVLLLLAVLGVGYDAIEFLVKILSR